MSTRKQSRYGGGLSRKVRRYCRLFNGHAADHPALGRIQMLEGLSVNSEVWSFLAQVFRAHLAFAASPYTSGLLLFGVFVTMAAMTFIDVLIAILLPPLGVFLRYGCALEFWICLLLTILGYIPGILYALYVLLM